jgi:hypothetical protein
MEIGNDETLHSDVIKFGGGILLLGWEPKKLTKGSRKALCRRLGTKMCACNSEPDFPL